MIYRHFLLQTLSMAPAHQGMLFFDLKNNHYLEIFKYFILMKFQQNLLHRDYYDRCIKNVDGDILCDAISVKTLFYLISTLNESFQPSYDFSQSRSEDFTLISDIPVSILYFNNLHSNLTIYFFIYIYIIKIKNLHNSMR